MNMPPGKNTDSGATFSTWLRASGFIRVLREGVIKREHRFSPLLRYDFPVSGFS